MRENGFWTPGKVVGLVILSIVLLVGGCYGVSMLLSATGVVMHDVSGEQ